MNIKKTFAVIFFLAVGFASWRWYGFLPPKVTLTAEERVNMEQFLQGMTPRCIGRYLIDLPASFTASPDSMIISIDESPVSYKRIYRPAFEQKIRLREATLKSKKTLNPLDMPFLKQVYVLPEGMDGVIFERNESISVPDVGRVLEAHFYINGVAVEIEMTADNGIADRYAERRNLHPEIYDNNVPQRLAELTALLKRISGKKETDIPTEAGLCLPELFIADSGGKINQKEDYGIDYISPDYPALKFDFDTDNFANSEDTLLERSAEMNITVHEADGRTLTSGKRTLNELYADQWLIEGKINSEGKRGLRFIMNIHENTVTPQTPRISLNFMQSGLGGVGALSENEAISSWQTITDTIRLRPGAFDSK